MFKRPVGLLLLIFAVLIIIADMFLPAVFLNNHYIKHTTQTDTFKYLITDSPKQTPKTLSYLAEIIAYYDTSAHQWHKTKGKIKIYIPKINSAGSPTRILKYGDVIVSSDKIQPIKNFDTVKSFNYVRYMRHKRIYRQVFIRCFSFEKANQGNKIIAAAKNVNILLQNRIKRSDMGINQQNLASAMLLGSKQDLDSQIRQQFNTSGLAHILCVSGLHIMLIVSAVSFLLKAVLPKNLTGLYIRNAAAILLCWAVAFIVGLTPSALRVAVMLTLLIISKFTPLNDDNINILLTTAFIFLCFDPLILFNISFQLSFLAVFGLLTIKPWLYNLIKIQRNKKLLFLNRPLSNMATTLSAQIFCFPVIILNFSRFPVLFLLTNLIVVPLMQIILISLIFMLIFTDVPLLNNVLSWLCNLEMSLLLETARIADEITSLIM